MPGSAPSASSKVSRTARGLEIFAAQLAGQVIGERLLQPVMLEDGGMDEAGQRGFAPCHGLGL